MRFQTTLLFLCAVFALIASLDPRLSAAHAPVSDEQSIRAIFTQWENVMNTPGHGAEAVRFMDRLIAPQAQLAWQSRPISKQDYITNFIRSASLADGYHVQIRDVHSQQDPQTHRNVTSFLIIERGRKHNPYAMRQVGQGFETRTTCTLSHEPQGDSHIMTGGHCSSVLALEQNI